MWWTLAGACAAWTVASAAPPVAKPPATEPLPPFIGVECAGAICSVVVPPATGRVRLVLHFAGARPKRLSVPTQGNVSAAPCGTHALCVDVDLEQPVAFDADGEALAFINPAPMPIRVELSDNVRELPPWDLSRNQYVPRREYEPAGDFTLFVIGGHDVGSGAGSATHFQITDGQLEPDVQTADLAVPDVVAVAGPAGYDCSGVAIAAHYILTARHCGAATHVAFGNRVAKPGAELAVDRTIPSPDPDADAELLHTAVAVPVAPRAYRAVAAAPPSGELRVIGFGVDNAIAGTGFGVKREFDTGVQGWGCDGARPRTTGCEPGVELVVATQTGQDTCNGDSGGAVLEQAGARWRLIAITSRAIAGETRCGRGGIYVRTDAIADWIDRVIEEQP